MSEAATVPAPRPKKSSSDRRLRPALALVWSAEEPGRVGEVVFPPKSGPGVLGRSGEGLLLGRQEAGAMRTTGPLTSSHISRQQLRLEAEGMGLTVANVGGCPLYVNGVTADQADLAPGDVIELEQAVVFVVVGRPDTIAAQVYLPRHRFGEADQLGIVGESDVAWAVRARIHRVAKRKGHALVLGASGTGKELVANALHKLSERGGRSMVSRNAATLPESLVDAELFGNPRNYPNPGMPEREGLIGAADGTTLFLDEIGELPVEVQTHLLRVLDHGEYQRLGESQVRRAAFRLIGATNRGADALKEDVAARFPVRIELPDLNSRREDVPLLARHRLRSMCAQDPALQATFFDDDGHPRFSPGFMRDLVRHDWRANVRELERILWQSVDESRGEVLEPVHLEGGPLAPVSAGESEALTAARIQAALDKHNGRQAEVWRELGLSSRHQLARLIKKHDIVVRRKGG